MDKELRKCHAIINAVIETLFMYCIV